MATVLVSLSAPIAADNQSDFVFAEKIERGWNFRATTSIASPANSPPYIREIFCSGSGPEGRFSMNRAAALNELIVEFLGPADEDGEREQITRTGDRLWIFLDSEKWELAMVPLQEQFSNVDYPQSEGEVILLWRGHKAVRKDGVGPWLHFSRFQERLLSAKKADWSFKSRNWDDVGYEEGENRPPKDWQSRRYALNIEPLRNGIGWCTQMVASDAAFRLPPEFQTAVAK